MTASVRSTDASVGSWIFTLKPLSSVRGMYSIPIQPSGTIAMKRKKAMATPPKSFFLCLKLHAMATPYASSILCSIFSTVRQSFVSGTCTPFLKNFDASIGVSVKEMKREKREAKTIVRPNCLKNCPVMLDMKAIGRKTTTSQSVIAMAAMPISIRPVTAASFASSPLARWRWIFSKTTIESSTRIPTQSVIPMSDIILKEKPAMYMTKNVEMSDVGIAMMTDAVERQPRRKKKSTSPVVMSPSMSVESVLWSAVRT